MKCADSCAQSLQKSDGHAFQLGLRRALAERGHHLAEFGGLDPAVVVLVEEAEGLLEFAELRVAQAVLFACGRHRFV